MVEKRIALDVMGGDQAPRSNLEGALRATDPQSASPLDPARLVLVGDEATIHSELAALGSDRDFAVLHAPDVIGMDEKPGQALRSKPKSSIAVCVGAVKQGAAGSVVSMGNTGAVVGASPLGLGTLPGVRRPGIAVTLELTGSPCTILDMGANVVPKPSHLLHYGVMGAIYARDCLGSPNPRVGLLNIGEEDSKGTDLMREAHSLLRDSDLNFVGNIEGGDIFQRAAEVIVTDGYTGNVALKLMEGLAGFMMGLLVGELGAHKVQWAPEALANVKKSIDYSEYGGALLLGVNGVVVIGHGRSDANAVANALGMACSGLDKGVNENIVQGLDALRSPTPGD